MRADRRKLEIAIANACLTVPEIVQRAGIPRPTYNNVLRTKNVRPATIGKVARALGVPVTDILEEEKEG